MTAPAKNNWADRPDDYLDKVDKFIFNGIALQHMAMTPQQKLRTLIVYEAYQIWMSDKQIKPMEVCRRIAARVYSDILTQSQANPIYKDIAASLAIKPGLPRSYRSLVRDVATLDHIIGRFNAPTANIEKAKVLDASDWLITEGMKQGNERSVKAGADLKMKLHKDFDEREEGFDNLAKTDINITGDVSVVKPGRRNYTEEEKRALAKRFGLPEREVEDLIQGMDGSYETAPILPDEEPDPFL